MYVGRVQFGTLRKRVDSIFRRVAFDTVRKRWASILGVVRFDTVVFSPRYGSLNASIGLDEASCVGRRSSPVDIPRALRGGSVEVPSALQYFPETIATCIRMLNVGWVGRS